MEKNLVEELHKVGKNVPLEQQTRMVKESCSAMLQFPREYEILLGCVGVFLLLWTLVFVP